MTFDEIVRDVADRTNLTSPEAFRRIGQRVNERYKKVTSSIGMEVTRRQTKDFTIDPSLPQYSQLPKITIHNFEKILRISTTSNGPGTGVIVLKHLTFDEIENTTPFDDRVPRAYADVRMGTDLCEIQFDSFLGDTPFDLHVEGYDVADTLADDATPFLPMSYHDILIEGALADEYAKMQMMDISAFREQKYEDRLGQLRLFIAKNAYQDSAQGRDKPSLLWYRPWFSRVSMWD